MSGKENAFKDPGLFLFMRFLCIISHCIFKFILFLKKIQSSCVNFTQYASTPPRFFAILCESHCSPWTEGVGPVSSRLLTAQGCQL